MDMYNDAFSTIEEAIDDPGETYAVTGDLTELSPGTKYYYRLVAFNKFGQSFAYRNGVPTDSYFRTLGSGDNPTPTPNPSTIGPYVFTGSADVSGGTATLNALIIGGTDTAWYFLYDTAPSNLRYSTYGGIITMPFGQVHETLSGFKGGVTYYYRVVGSNGNGIAYGDILSFQP